MGDLCLTCGSNEHFDHPRRSPSMDEPLTAEQLAELRDVFTMRPPASDFHVAGLFFLHGPALLDAAEKAKERGRLAVKLNHINDDLMAEVVGFQADLARLHAVAQEAKEGMLDAFALTADAQAEVDRLHAVIRKAVEELTAAHRLSAPSRSRRVGCATCYPEDADWPCAARRVADDLRVALVESRALPEGLEA